MEKLYMEIFRFCNLEKHRSVNDTMLKCFRDIHRLNTDYIMKAKKCSEIRSDTISRIIKYMRIVHRESYGEMTARLYKMETLRYMVDIPYAGIYVNYKSLMQILKNSAKIIINSVSVMTPERVDRLIDMICDERESVHSYLNITKEYDKLINDASN